MSYTRSGRQNDIAGDIVAIGIVDRSFLNATKLYRKKVGGRATALADVAGQPKRLVKGLYNVRHPD